MGRNVAIVMVARVVMSAGRAIAAVVTALYLADLGFSGTAIGALFVAVTMVSAVLSTGIGLLPDRWGRRPFLIVVPLLTSVAGVAFAETRARPILFLAASLGSFGRGGGAGAGNVGPYQPAESALIAEAVDPAHRATAFGRVAFASSLGALVGGLAAAVVRHAGPSSPAKVMAAYRPAFVFVAVLSAMAGLLALGIRESRPSPRSNAGERPPSRWPTRSWSALWRFGVTNATNGVAIGLFGPFVSYWLYRRYGASPGAIGLLFAIVNLVSLVPTLAAAGIARRVGTVRAITAVRAIGGALLIPMVLAPSYAIAGSLYVLRMLVQRVGLPLRQSLTQDLAHPDERASVAALSNLPAQATMAGGQALAGYLFDEVSLAAPFELAALIQMVNAVLYGVLFAGRDERGGDGRARRSGRARADAPSPMTESDGPSA